MDKNSLRNNGERKSIPPTGFIYRLYTIPPIVEKIFFYIRVGNFVLEKQKRKQNKKENKREKKITFDFELRIIE